MDFQKLLRNFFIISLFFVSTFLIINTAVLAETSLEKYCDDGYYKLDNEPVCSRAPKCDGKGYDEVAGMPAPNAQACMGDKDGERYGCRGWVPLCCYEVARTGDFTKCVGYWERLWCSPILCDQAKEKGASDDQCGGSCLCGHAFKSWCKGEDAKPPIPVETRIKGEIPYGSYFSFPTNTPTPTPTLIPTSTPRPTPTSIPTSIPTSPPTSTPKPTPTSTPASYPTDSKINMFPTRNPIQQTDKNTKTAPEKIIPEKINTPLKELYKKIKNFFGSKKIEITPEKIQNLDKKFSKITDIPVNVFKKVTEADKNLEMRMNSLLKELVMKSSKFIKND